MEGIPRGWGLAYLEANAKTKLRAKTKDNSKCKYGGSSLRSE
jgi:hypothetical protein